MPYESFKKGVRPGYGMEVANTMKIAFYLMASVVLAVVGAKADGTVDFKAGGESGGYPGH